jgi:hypothetical protein
MTTKKGHECPPWLYLFQVANHCPKAVSIYMLLWDKKDDFNRIKVKLSDIRIEYLTTFAKFSNQLLYLVKEGLINVNQRTNKTGEEILIIELVGWDEEDKSICW